MCSATGRHYSSPTLLSSTTPLSGILTYLKSSLESCDCDSLAKLILSPLKDTLETSAALVAKFELTIQQSVLQINPSWRGVNFGAGAMSGSPPQRTGTDIIHLNVGGKKFSTSRQTLTQVLEVSWRIIDPNELCILSGTRHILHWSPEWKNTN